MISTRNAWRKTIKEFARTSLVNLIRTCLEETTKADRQSRAGKTAAVRNAHFPAEEKRNFLEDLWQRTNPETILGIGFSVQKASYDPIWKMALNSSSPQRLFEGWKRFEKFAHSTNRVAISSETENSAGFKRYSVTPKSPNPIENHLICGLMIALLQGIGCKSVVCTTPNEAGEWVTIYANSTIERSVNQCDFKFATWHILWDRFDPPVRPNQSNELLSSFLMSLTVKGQYKAMVEKIVRAMIPEISRNWKVEELAMDLGTSKRSLQRMLAETDLSFSSVVRSLRIHIACDLLKRVDHDISTVGYCAGFSDSSHFSRDFRASMGMSPSEFKRNLQM